MSEFSSNNFSASPPESEAEQLMLEMQRRAVAFQNEQEQEQLVSLLTFNLAKEWFALPLDRVKLVSRLTEVTPVPGTSRYVLGVINYKSAIYPLLDIHELLHLDTPIINRASRFVIVSHNQHSFAVLVDAMTEVREVPEYMLEGQLRHNPDISNYIRSEIKIEARLLGLLNLEAILQTVAEGD